MFLRASHYLLDGKACELLEVSDIEGLLLVGSLWVSGLKLFLLFRQLVKAPGLSCKHTNVSNHISRPVLSVLNEAHQSIDRRLLEVCIGCKHVLTRL